MPFDCIKKGAEFDGLTGNVGTYLDDVVYVPEEGFAVVLPGCFETVAEKHRGQQLDKLARRPGENNRVTPVHIFFPQLPSS